METKRTRHATYQINYHFVWGPKYRRPVLTGRVGDRLVELVRQSASELGGGGIELAGRPGHVHVVATCPPTSAADQIMRRIKGATARPPREEFPPATGG